MAQIKKKILVIDDESVVREIFARVFNDCNLIFAEDGVSAVKICHDQQDIKVAFMDIHMPGLSGVALFDTLLQKNPLLKIVVVSGFAPESHADGLLLRQRTHAWVEKPFDLTFIRKLCFQLIEG